MVNLPLAPQRGKDETRDRNGKGAGTGGLQTSALALGSARGSIELLVDEAMRRADLVPVVDGLTRSLAAPLSAWDNPLAGLHDWYRES